MSVSNQETQFPYIGNGVTVTFPYNCQVQKAGDLDVYVAGLLLTSGFTINGVGSLSGGSVTFAVAPAAGVSVVLERVVDLERTTDYQQNGDFLARVVNPDFDRLWMALQQFRTSLGRALRFPRGDINALTELPTADVRANKILSFDSLGNPTVTLPTTGSALDLQIALAEPTGAGMIGNDGETVAQSLAATQFTDYPDLRLYTGTRRSANITGYLVSAAPCGKAGEFVFDPADTTTPDNNCTVIVDVLGRRWKRQYSGGVDIRWSGARPAANEAGFDSTAAIVSAKAVADAAKQPLLLPNGSYNCSAVLPLNTSNMIFGNGQSASKIRFTGAGNFQSNRAATQDFVELRYFGIERAPSGTADIGIDMGTLRRAILDTVYVTNFKIGVSQDMGVELVANYWNRLFNVTAECTGQAAVGSVGFLFGNNVQTSYPDTDYNNMVGCKSFQCETAILGVNMIGCKIIGHQCTVVGTALNLISGNNNEIQLVAENCIRMGGASAAATGNKLDLYNDGDLAVKFQDNGWNYHSGQIIGGQRMANESREIDAFIRDRIHVSHTLASKGIFLVTTDAAHAAYTVTTTCSGYVTGGTASSCVQVWDVRRVGGATPTVTLVRTTGTSMLYTDVAANGEVLWSITGTAGQLSVFNISLEIQGFSTKETSPFAKFLDYKRSEGL